MSQGKRIDWQALRERLAQAGAPQSWRSLEALAATEEFQEAVRREFPAGAEQLADPISRRRFLQLAAASLGLAGLTACVGPPGERILPYVDAPEQLTPGEPLYYATAHLLGGYATGILAESHMGRPTRVEGNLLHPASRGASDTFAQASILSLYDPDRSTDVRLRGRRATWDLFEGALRDAIGESGPTDSRLRILTPTVTSPTLIRQLEQLLGSYPQAVWRQYEPVNWDNAYLGAYLAFGHPRQAVYDFDRADVILSLDADFLGSFPGRLRYTRDFSQRRMVDPDGLLPSVDGDVNRLYSVAPTPTLTTSMADHHWPLRPAAVLRFANSVARHLGVALPPEAETRLRAAEARAAEAVAADLRAHRGRSLVLAGMAQPPEVHALAHYL
ncbi:MAG: TAT-variant-translocated molybdopterin oxidoreductase, partial [Candidatus Promineifilaceae bacterium]|nr:TAT-variant-translocated molybdopterin oxidoreductase [Candidatus Promineifilaceae bacterium]